MMMIYQSTIGCPQCGNRVEKVAACSHLRCGSNYYDRDPEKWRGRGCGFTFCEYCETPLHDPLLPTDCGVNTCNFPAKRDQLQRAREEIKKIQEVFQATYIHARVADSLREAAATVADRFQEGGCVLLQALDKVIEARCAQAHALVFRRLEVGGTTLLLQFLITNRMHI